VKHNPLVPAAFVLAAGILSGWYAGGPAGFLLFLVFLGPGAGLFFFLPAGKRFYWFLLLFFFLAGVARGAGERRENDRFSEYTRAFAGKTVTVLGRVADLPAPWRGGCRFPLDLEAVDGEEAPAGLRWEVFLAGSEPALDAGALGKRLLIRGRVFGERDGEAVPAARVTRWTREKIGGGLMVGAGGYLSYHEASGTPELAATPVPRTGRQPGLAGMAIAAARRRLLVVGERTLSPQAAALLHGMLLGVHEGLPAATAGDFRRAGVAHLLSVSGLHLLFWLSLFWGLGKLLGLSERWLAVFSLPLVLVFLLLAGAGAPALRAGVMSLAAIFGRRWRQPVRSENLLALAACVILLLRPLDLFSRGFWLSFAACGGLLFLLPVWEEAFADQFKAKYKGWFRPLLVSLAAQAGTAPLCARFFGGVTLLAPFANLILVPLGSACIQLGLLAAMGGLVFFPAARVLNAGNEILLGCFHRILGFFAEFGGYLRVSLPWPAVGGFYALTAVFTWGLIRNPINRRRRIPLFYLLLILFVLVLAGLGWALAQQFDPALEMVLFDVGQGDAIFFAIPGGYYMMVDGGTSEGYGRGVRPYLREHGIDRLDLLVLTHPHDDHLGGLVRMLEEDEIRVAHVLESGYPHTTRGYARFLEIIAERGLPFTRAARGTSFRLGKMRGLVLHPPASHLSGTRSDVNNNSIVLLLDYEDIRILLTGDLEKEAEDDLLAAYGNLLRANILKVAHHGAATSTSWELVAVTSPDLAVISAGKGNPFGHPAPVVLENLARAGAVIWRTDTDGRLELSIRKGRVEMKRRAGN
jgi:competence protein ComEC